MPASCSAYGCTNRHKAGGRVKFFGFPLRNPTLVPLWVEAIKRGNFIPTKSSKVCSDHFTPSDYMERPGSYIQRLKPNAIPSRLNSLLIKTGVLDEPEINIDILEETTLDPLAELDTNYVNCRDEQQTDQSKLLLNASETQKDANAEMELVTKKSELKIRLVYSKDHEAQTDESSSSYTDSHVQFLRLRMRALNQQLRRRNKKIKQLKKSLKELEKNGVIEDMTRKLREINNEDTTGIQSDDILKL